jgi:hypothetical protein
MCCDIPRHFILQRRVIIADSSWKKVVRSVEVWQVTYGLLPLKKIIRIPTAGPSEFNVA